MMKQTGVMSAILLSAALLAQLSAQQAVSPRLLEVSKALDVKTLQQAQAAKTARLQLLAMEDAAARVSAAAREQQRKAQEAERLAQESRNQFRVTFIEAVEQLRQENAVPLGRYQTLFTALAIGAVVLALASSVFAFVKWSIVAGICSIVTTAVLTAPNVFSVRENLEFYRYIDTQSYALGLEANVTDQPAQTDVERWKDRWLKLATFVGSPPSVKDPDQLTRTIIQAGG